MIFRITQKLSAKIKAGPTATVQLDANPFADWSAAVFQVGRTQYLLLTNTTSLYSTVIPGKGITSEELFVEAALEGIREQLDHSGYPGVFDRHVASNGNPVAFSKALNRSVTGSMNDMTKLAKLYLTDRDCSLIEIASRLNDTPMSALEQGGSKYGFPRRVFAAMVAGTDGNRPLSDS